MNQASIIHFNKQLSLLPGELQQEVAAIFNDIAEQLPDLSTETPDWAGVLPHVLCSSPFIVGLIRRDPAYLNEIISNNSLFAPLDTDKLLSTIKTTVNSTENESELMCQLRYVRNQTMLQIAFRDLAGWATLNETMASLSRAAEIIISVTLSRTHELISKKSGNPVGYESGDPQKMLILGMGKLGGGELNFSSDVDLIFCFPENGETDSKRPISNSEFFIHQARLFIKLLTTQTADGFVYRVDTRLRPNGNSGPLCLSFSAMENYYQLHGRDWERYAYIKANIVAGSKRDGNQILEILRPFVYRKYLDFAAVESIREMKEMIERELIRKKELQKNIKLGPGGIREVEFIAQAHQLIRGGRNTTLQQRSLLAVLYQLFKSNLISENDLHALTQAYEFLRRCENRIQMYADRQTHNLPDDPRQQCILALTMGFPDWSSFHELLQLHRLNIHRVFQDLFMSSAAPDQNPLSKKLTHLWNNELDDETALELLSDNHYQRPAELYTRLCDLRTGSLYHSLTSSAKDRLDRLLPVMLYEVGLSASDKGTNSEATMIRCLELLSSIVRRPVYLSLLLDNTAIRQRLIRLTSASPYVSVLINRHPILLDELLIGYTLADFDKTLLLTQLHKLISSAEQDDLEQQMTLLREFHHNKQLAVATLGISTKLSARETGRSLSSIAEACVTESLQLSINNIISSHGLPKTISTNNLPFCVVAYGKLGSQELGFSSDLDLVFISESVDGSHKTTGPRKITLSQYFARIGQRLVHILTTRTMAGQCYEVDMRLRPSGESGPLVTTIKRMQGYQRENAWTWEHQALIRARIIAGDKTLAEKFNALRIEILTRPRNDINLRKDIVEMREKMRSVKITRQSGKFDLKQGSGGIVDIEFMVQYTVLRWANKYPQLTTHTETLELLDALVDLGLLEQEQHRILSTAFSNWLEISYQLTLNELNAVIPDNAENPLRRQVNEIWDKMFPGDAG